uniref:AlNc14C76G5088 protein n=1 Tax=Albugo laibachii Nc14 TaxID=890382 RepID=F0WEN8_9STRA|nr:AlNc14C76G5088 [Albugo laibachii Nc14]|eukprot:CCA19670.1 AlNc14C76G5088 [Albugo laibachii Nc14]
MSTQDQKNSKAWRQNTFVRRKDSQALNLPNFRPGAAESVENGASVITNVFVVQWKEATVECVKCLAQYGEVLLFSTHRSYAWMIQGTLPVNCWPCGDCGHLRIDNRSKLNIYPLRPMSFVKISRILGEEGSSCDKHGPLDVPFGAMNSKEG